MIFLYFFRKPSGLVPKYPNLRQEIARDDAKMVNHWPGRHVGLHRTGRLPRDPKREPRVPGRKIQGCFKPKTIRRLYIYNIYIYICKYTYTYTHTFIYILVHIYIYKYAHPLTHLYQSYLSMHCFLHQQCDAVLACFKVCRICSKDWFSNAS